MEKVPYWRKCLLTIKEAALLSDRSPEEIEDLINSGHQSLVLRTEKIKLIKRDAFKHYLMKEADRKLYIEEGGRYHG